MVIRPNTPSANLLVKQVVPKLVDQGYEVSIEETGAKEVGFPEKGIKLQEMQPDLIISFGGDGTILHVLRTIPDPETLIFGVNFGHRGVLSEVDPQNFDEAWFLIENEKYIIQSCPQVAAEINGERVSDALNESLLTASTPSKIIEVEVYLDKDLIMSGKLDGVIVASTTGSTAYSLSAGGPLVHPSLDCFVIVPLFPINFDLRPVVASTSTSLSIHMTMPHRNGLLTVDGQHSYKVDPGSVLDFYTSERSAQFVRIHRRVPRMRMKLTKRT
jgi:NAD+ kinase